MNPVRTIVLASAGLALSVSSAWAQNTPPAVVAKAGQPLSLSATLPVDGRILQGTLPNGMRYLVMKHAVPPGRSAAWLHVSSGSLNETDQQRGVAHFLEHMAFNGSENFPPGTVIDFFQSLGLTFGRHQNASTGFDRTNFRLEMADNKPETLDKALMFLSDVAFRLTLPIAEIDAERGIILEEKRTRLGAQQRVQETWLKRMSPGSIMGERLPIGIEETIKGMTRDDFADYYKMWYVPSNMSIAVVADMEAADIEKLIKARFSAGKPSERPKDRDVGVKPTDVTRGVIITDPELSRATVAIVRIDNPTPPATTVGGLRAQMVEQIAALAFNRRMEKKVAKAQLSGLSMGLSLGTFSNVLRLSEIRASGEPAKWEAMLRDVATELQRARVHGFAESEVDDAKREIHAQIKAAFETESTRNAIAVLGSWDQALSSGEPITSAQQDMELANAILPGVTAAEVAAALVERFNTSAVTVMVQGPSSMSLPSEDDLAKKGTELLAAKPDAEAVAARPTALLSEVPKPAPIGTAQVHPQSEVATWTLPNGVIVHHRFMDYRKNAVSFQVILAGGELLESDANRGVSDAAIQAWNTAATSKLASTEITDLMVGKNARVVGNSQPDALSLSVGGTPQDIEVGLQLAHLLLTDPKIEQAAFDRWKTGQLQSLQNVDKTPQRVLAREMLRMIFPEGEARVQSMTIAQVEALSRDAAQAWLSEHIKNAPIEVSVVGDLSRERTAELVGRYIATLPSRAAVSTKTYADKRIMKRPTGARARNFDLVTQTKQAQVMRGFYGADLANVPDTRTLAAAAQILSTRVISRVREKENLVYSARVQSTPGVQFPGFGTINFGASTDPAKAERLAQVVGEIYAEFAAQGPTEEEVDVVRKQLANRLDEQLKEPGYWMRAMQTLAYRGGSLGDVFTEAEFYQTVTAAQIKDVFAKYHNAGDAWTMIVKPKAE